MIDTENKHLQPPHTQTRHATHARGVKKKGRAQGGVVRGGGGGGGGDGAWPWP
jgi:hypothetical protein